MFLVFYVNNYRKPRISVIVVLFLIKQLQNGNREAYKKGTSFLRRPVITNFDKESIVNIETFSDILVGTEDRYRVTFFEKEVGREFQYDFAISLDR